MSTVDLSRRHEAHVCAELGAVPTKGSGNQAERSDIRIKGVLRGECKATEKLSRAVSGKEWDTAARIAAMGQEEPALFLRLDAAGRVPVDLAVVDLDLFRRLLEAYRERA